MSAPLEDTIQTSDCDIKLYFSLIHFNKTISSNNNNNALREQFDLRFSFIKTWNTKETFKKRTKRVKESVRIKY